MKDNQEIKRRSYLKKETKKSEGNRIEDKVFVYVKTPTLGELARTINIPVGKIIGFLMGEKRMLTINSSLSDEDIMIITDHFGFDFRKDEATSELDISAYLEKDDPKDLKPRAPVVTIMGHVDHGKTTLIDTIRDSHVADKEAGAITQAIGAYQVECRGRLITFIDTPGHEAFSHMRSRGASITDIVVLVVAADDGVMMQTKEAIDHAKAAGVPIIVAINKIDKPGSDPEKVKTELMSYNIIPEEYGGDVVTVNISAKFNKGIDNLLESILLVADMHELKANPNRYAYGVVLETNLDKGEGPKATMLVENGTLLSGDYLAVGTAYGKIRKMTNEAGKVLKSAGPSTPVQVSGLNVLPSAGDTFIVLESEKEARDLAEKRKISQRQEEQGQVSNLSIENLFDKISEGQLEEIKLVIKTDTTGSAEAIKSALMKIDVPNVKINIVRAAAGAVTESDVTLASAAHAILYCFNLRPSAMVRKKAEEAKVEIRVHDVIYALIEEIEGALKGKLKPVMKEEIKGSAKVLTTFKASKIGTIGGAIVTEGSIKRNSLIHLIRDGVRIYDGKLGSLKHEKEDIKEAKINLEFGFTIDGYHDIQDGDILEAYEMVEEARK